jgi:hypothetical protein
MREANNLSTGDRIAKAEEAYRKFSNIMAGLSERQKMIIGEAIKKIENQQIEKIRKKLNLN